MSIIVAVVTVVIITLIKTCASRHEVSSDNIEILAPSDYSDPKVGLYHPQYSHLNWMITALFFLSTKKLSYDFPGANMLSENISRDAVFWTDVFKPMGNNTPTKTVNLMETANKIDLSMVANFERLVDFLKEKISYQPDFYKELDARKMEWKKTFNISDDREYVSFHMRRTDKVGTESTYCSAIQYLSYMLSENKEWPRNIFIMTDDPRAVEEVKMFIPVSGLVAVHSAAEFTRCKRSISLNTRYTPYVSINIVIKFLFYNYLLIEQKRGDLDNRGWVLDSLAELEIAAVADLLVVQSGSNVATTLNLFRYARKQGNIKPIIATDLQTPLHTYWNRILQFEQPLNVCPLTTDLEIHSPLVACNMPWWSSVVSIQHNRLLENSSAVNAIVNLVDSLAVLAHGLIPFKFSPQSPFLDGLCGTSCPATVEISADELGAGWRNLTAMEHLRRKWNFKFAIPSSRILLLKFVCEKLSLSLYNVDYERSYAVCTWMNVKRVLLFSRLVLKPVIRNEVEKTKALIKTKHSITGSFAVFHFDTSTLSELGVELAAQRYWSMFLEARGSVPCCLRKVLVTGHSAHAVNRLISGIKNLEGAMINEFAMNFISVAVFGKGRYVEPGEHRNNTSTSLFIEVWASVEVIAQADVVIMDDLSEVGQLVSLMRPYYQKPSAFSIRSNLGDNNE